MKFYLKVVVIETKPRAGYYILDDGKFMVVKKVVPQKNEVHFTNGVIMSIEDASKKVAKLIGEVTITKDDKEVTRTYSIIHSDYDRVINHLNSEIDYSKDVSEEEKKYKTYAGALLDGIKIEYNGSFEEILTRSVVDDVVKICSLNIIDRYQIYSQDDRIGVITKFNKISHNFVVKLNTSGTEIKCRREDFMQQQNDNIVRMIHVTCPMCKR